MLYAAIHHYIYVLHYHYASKLDLITYNHYYKTSLLETQSGGIIIIIMAIIELVDSRSRDERDAPKLQTLALGTLSRILNTTIVFYG